MDNYPHLGLEKRRGGGGANFGLNNQAQKKIFLKKFKTALIGYDMKAQSDRTYGFFTDFVESFRIRFFLDLWGSKMRHSKQNKAAYLTQFGPKFSCGKIARARRFLYWKRLPKLTKNAFLVLVFSAHFKKNLQVVLGCRGLVCEDCGRLQQGW